MIRVWSTAPKMEWNWRRRRKRRRGIGRCWNWKTHKGMEEDIGRGKEEEEGEEGRSGRDWTAPGKSNDGGGWDEDGFRASIPPFIPPIHHPPPIIIFPPPPFSPHPSPPPISLIVTVWFWCFSYSSASFHTLQIRPPPPPSSSPHPSHPPFPHNGSSSHQASISLLSMPQFPPLLRKNINNGVGTNN